jgi:hypothetical protein
VSTGADTQVVEHAVAVVKATPSVGHRAVGEEHCQCTRPTVLAAVKLVILPSGGHSFFGVKVMQEI